VNCGVCAHADARPHNITHDWVVGVARPVLGEDHPDTLARPTTSPVICPRWASINMRTTSSSESNLRTDQDCELFCPDPRTSSWQRESGSQNTPRAQQQRRSKQIE